MKPKTAEEVFNEIPYSEGLKIFKYAVIDAMNAYASQFHPSPKEISEEEIKKLADEYCYSQGMGRLRGQRWLDFIAGLQKALSLPSSGSKTEEEKYRISLIDELINMQEHPEDSNKEWKDAIISAAREKGYGNKK